MRKQKYLIIIGVISLFAFGGLLFAKPGEGQSSHRSRGRGQSERSAPTATDVEAPTPQPASSEGSALTPTETPAVVSPSPTPASNASNVTSRRERIRKKFRRELAEEADRRGDTDEIRVIIRYRNPQNETHIRKIQARGGRLKKKFKHHPWAAFTVKKADLFEEDFDVETVEGIEFDSPVSPHLNTSLPSIGGATIEKTYGVTGKGVKVAIIDSGIAKNHPALAGKVVSEVDLTTTGEGPGDLNGHGTHVACIVACSDQIYNGVAPEVSLYNAKVLSGTGAGFISDVIAGIEWAMDQKVNVINLSLGAATTLCDGKDSLSVAVNTAFDKGIFPVVSAGNSGPAVSTMNSPGCAEKAFTVGAVSDTGVVAEFSSRGPTADGRTKPDITAPGMDVISADLNAGFVSKYGTSMAAPHVTGVAALLKSMAPTKTPTEIRELLFNTAGAGFVSAERSVAALKNQLAVPPPPEQTPPEPPPPPPQEPPQESTPPSEPEKQPSEPISPPQEEPEKEKHGRGNPLSRCLKGARGNHEEKRECLKEFNPGVHRGFEKIPEKDLKSIERIIFQIPVPDKKIDEQLQKKLDRFEAKIEKGDDVDIVKEVAKFKKSLIRFKRRAAKKARRSTSQ